MEDNMFRYQRKDRRTGIVYVYEQESYWVPELKQSRAKRKVIGKLDEKGKFVPTEKRATRIVSDTDNNATENNALKTDNNASEPKETRENPQNSEMKLSEQINTNTEMLKEMIKALEKRIIVLEKQNKEIQNKSSYRAKLIRKIANQLLQI